MRVRLTPNVGAALGDLHVQTRFSGVAIQSRCLAGASLSVFPFKLTGQAKISRVAVDGSGFGGVERHPVSCAWRGHADLVSGPRRGIRKNRQRQDSRYDGRPPKTAITQMEESHKNLLSG